MCTKNKRFLPHGNRWFEKFGTMGSIHFDDLKTIYLLNILSYYLYFCKTIFKNYYSYYKSLITQKLYSFEF